MKASTHFAQFCLSLTQSEDRWEGQPLKLETWQKRFWRDALEGDWRSVVLILPRKNGKTQMLAAYALWRLVYEKGRPEILLAAASDRQAGRLFDAAARFVRRHPGLSERLRVRDHEGTIVREDGLGSIIRLTFDPSRLFGYSPTDVVCDELAFWSTPSLRRAYAALTSGGGARSAPRTFTITTAGEASQRHDSLLGAILDKALGEGEVVRPRPGLTVARLPEAQTLVYSYEAPTQDPHNIKAMKQANPASWITRAYLRRQAENPELTAAECLQLHGCVWAATDSTWIAPEAWAACTDRGRVVAAGEQVVLGFDGSSRRDSTVLAGCTLDGHVFAISAWEKPDGVKDWRVPRQEVMDDVAAAMDGYEVLELACDPYEWRSEVEQWTAVYGDRVTEVPTNSRQRFGPMCDRFRAAVLEQRLTHAGHEILARHLGNAHAKATPYGTTIEKQHPDPPKRIDAIVACVLAYDRAMWHQANPPAPRELPPMVAWGR